jgi:hypothetical protein
LSSLESANRKTGLFGFRTQNIGDDVQSYAAACHFPTIDRLIDRDQFAFEEFSEPHTVIFNSWFMAGDTFATPRDSIDPLFFGFCVGKEAILNKAWLSYLEKHQPIGCRDTFSVEILAKHGIKAYWTGCLTLYFGRAFKPVPAEQRSGVVILDISPETEERVIPPELRERATRLSNFIPGRHQQNRVARFAAVARLCDQLRRAELVITRRLHAALPCVGFQTPVIALPKEAISLAKRRFSGYESFLPMAYQGEIAAEQSLDWDRRTPPEVPAELEQHYQSLLRQIEERVGKPPSELYEKAFYSDRITLRNPGLGCEPGRVLISTESDEVECDIFQWTDREIEVYFPNFATLERWTCQVMIEPRKGKRIPELRLSDLIV